MTAHLSPLASLFVLAVIVGIPTWLLHRSLSTHSPVPAQDGAPAAPAPARPHVHVEVCEIPVSQELAHRLIHPASRADFEDAIEEALLIANGLPTREEYLDSACQSARAELEHLETVTKAWAGRIHRLDENGQS